MGKKFGVSFSWNRLLGISGMKNRISRQIGIPLTRSGRNQKFGRYFTNAFLIPTHTRNISKDKLEKYQFLANINERMQNALLLYLVNKGVYFANLEDFKRIELNFLEEYIDDNIKKALSEYQENIRLINDGGNLTSKRKDIFLKTIYLLENKNNNNNLNNFKIICNYEKLKKRNNIYYCTIEIGIFVLSGIILATGELSNRLSAIILFTFYCLFLFIPVFFLLKYNNGKIKLLQEEIQQNFKYIYSDIKKTPNIFIKNQLKEEKSLSSFIFWFTIIFIIILAIVPKDENKNEKQMTQEEFEKIQNI